MQRLNSAAHSFSRHTDEEQSSELGQSWVFSVSRAFCFDLHRVSRFSSLNTQHGHVLISFISSFEQKSITRFHLQEEINPKFHLAVHQGVEKTSPATAGVYAEFWHQTFAQPLKLLSLRPEK